MSFQNKQKVFITGASGCIGHYVLDQFKQDPNYELHLLVRDPKKVHLPEPMTPQVQFHIGNLERIEAHQDIISQCDALIHIATDWSNSDYAIKLNVEKTEALFWMAKNAKRIVYFSTASILGPGNKPIVEAETYGTGYVKSKYLGYQALQNAPYRDKVVTLFPTLVFGGDATHPYSHISSGLIPNAHYLAILRFFTAKAACHFMHAKDIAVITKYVMENNTPSKQYVLGYRAITLDQIITTLCRQFRKRRWFKIPISAKFVFKLAERFKIEIDPWTRYCIYHPMMVYDTVSPSSFGLINHFPTLESIVSDIQARHDR